MLQSRTCLYDCTVSVRVAKKYETNFIFISLAINKVILGKLYNKMTSSTYPNLGLVCYDITSSRYLEVNLDLATTRRNMNEIYSLMVTRL